MSSLSIHPYTLVNLIDRDEALQLVGSAAHIEVVAKSEGFNLLLCIKDDSSRFMVALGVLNTAMHFTEEESSQES